VAKSSSKIISGGGAEQVQQWCPPSMEQPGAGHPVPEGQGSLLTADQLEQLQKEAYQEGFEQGKKEGFEYGHKEALSEGREQIRESVQHFESLLETLDSPLRQLDDQVERELVDLVIAMVRQLVRREIKSDPGQIIGVVRESLAILPVSSRHIRVLLHPEDASLVREIFDLNDADLGWKIVEDPVLTRGGCRIQTETSQVDASLESRLAAVIAPLLGGERGQDQVE